YKGRTYIFAHIDYTKPSNVNSYFEADGIVKQFVLNGRLVHSIYEINSQYRRKDIRSINLLFSDQAKEKYSIDGSILEIETFDYKTITKNEELNRLSGFETYDYSKLNFDDPEVKRKWREMISEIKTIAWKEGKAAYEY